MRYGVANMDLPVKEWKGNSIYTRWQAMLDRCYSKRQAQDNPTYTECVVCAEWLTFSTFHSWVITQTWEGKQLDKDMRVPGSNIYSPGTCVFISAELNNLFHKHEYRKGEYPTGVKKKISTGRFSANISLAGQDKHLGYFKTPEEASVVYEAAKKQRVLELLACETLEVQKALRHLLT